MQEKIKTYVDCYYVVWYSPGTCFGGLPGPYAPLASFLCWMIPDPGRCGGYQDLGQPVPARMITSRLRYITKIFVFSLSFSFHSLSPVIHFKYISRYTCNKIIVHFMHLESFATTLVRGDSPLRFIRLVSYGARKLPSANTYPGKVWNMLKRF